MGSNVGCQLRSKSKTNYQSALKTQAHIGSGVVLAECILRPLATASKSTQTDSIVDHVKSHNQKKSLAQKRLAFSKKFSIEQEAKKSSDLQVAPALQERRRRSHRKFV
jgi:hypothetical protein